MTDTFGKALIAYLDGGTAIHEIERDDERIETTETGWYFTPFDKWSDVEKDVAGRARLVRGTGWEVVDMVMPDDPKDSLYGVVLGNTK